MEASPLPALPLHMLSRAIKRPFDDDDGNEEPSIAPPANPIFVAADHGRPSQLPPAKVARLGGGDDGADYYCEDDRDGQDENATGVKVEDLAVEKVADDDEGGRGDAWAPLPGEVSPDEPPLSPPPLVPMIIIHRQAHNMSGSSNPVEDEEGGGGGLNEGDGGVDEEEEMVMTVVADAVDIAEDMPSLPPLEGTGTGEGVSDHPDHGVAVIKQSKKDRREFTAEEKLAIISEIGTMPSVQSVLDKYGVSKSSLHRWRQPEKLVRLQEMVRGSGGGGADEGDDLEADGEDQQAKPGNPNVVVVENRDKLRKRDLHDKLRLIKLRLQEFCKENMNRAEDERLAITSSLIQLKAAEIKEDLLGRGEIRDADELVAVGAFKASKSWACLLGNQFGYLSSGASIKWSDAQKANTATYLEAHSRAPSRAKKNRMEFTAEEKLTILLELEETNARNKTESQPAVTVEQICQKHSTSKSSLHRWKQQYRSGRLQQLATASSGYSNSKRISTDKLHVIKRALHNFYIENENAPPEKKAAINYNVLQAKAIEARDLLLERHHATVMTGTKQPHEHEQPEQSSNEEEGESGGGGEGALTREEAEGEGGELDQERHTREEERVEGGDGKSGSGSSDVMSKEEANALEGFKASSSWLRETAKKFGWKLDLDGKRDELVDAVDDEAMVVYHHQDHHHYHDDGGMMDHVVLEQHAEGTGQHVVAAQDEMAMGLGGIGNDDGSGIVQGGGHQQHLMLAMSGYDAQGDAMEDVVDFNHDDGTSFDV